MTMNDNIINLCEPRDRVDQILFDMEEAVREAVNLSEILLDASSNRFSSSSPGAREYLAMLLLEKTKCVEAEWRRALDAALLVK
jgi:hypothetical protein